jgi:hypothetical protein
MEVPPEELYTAFTDCSNHQGALWGKILAPSLLLFIFFLAVS